MDWAAEQALLTIAEQTTSETLRRYPQLRHDAHEILSDALLGIAKALTRYDPSLGVPINAYARARARGEVLDGLRSRSTVSRAQYQQGVTVDDLVPAQRPPLPLEAPAPVTDPGYARIEHQLTLATLIAQLRPRRARVIIEYYLHDRTLADIAAELGITESACSLHRTHALADLRNLLTRSEPPDNRDAHRSRS